MKSWETDYKGHRIRVENEMRAERLVIDGCVQDARQGLATRRVLRGAITALSGSLEPVLVELSEGNDEGVACQIIVAGQTVYTSGNARLS